MNYSIEINRSPGRPCANCRAHNSAEGPVGHQDGDPICDVCLLVGDQDLGLLLALGILVRAYAADVEQSSERSQTEGLRLLSLFAMLFDRQASWPRRNEFTDDHTLAEGGGLDGFGLEVFGLGLDLGTNGEDDPET